MSQVGTGEVTMVKQDYLPDKSYASYENKHEMQMLGV